MPHISKSFIDLKATRFKKASFSTGINDIEENIWSNWVVNGNMQIKLKWNWLNDENNVIMQIHDKQALHDEKNPDENYVYYVHLEDPFRKRGKAYDFAIKEINITGSYPPQKRRQLIKEVNEETGLNKEYETNKKASSYYLIKKIMPALGLINILGAELTADDFYEIKDTSILPTIEQKAGIICFGIVPKTLIKVNKFHEPYTYFFDEVDKKYLLDAVGFINMYSAQLAKKSDKKINSFKEKLFFLSHIFADIDRAYSNSEIALNKSETTHIIKRYFKYDKKKLYEIGMKMFDAKKYKVSVEYFQQAVKQDPFFEPAWNRLGSAFCLLRNWDAGLQSLDKAIDINPSNHDSYYFRALILFSGGFFNEAYNDMKQAILLDNGFHAYFSLMSKICIQMCNNDRALDNIDKAIELCKNDILYIDRADIHFNLALYNESISDCNIALKLNPNNKKALVIKHNAFEMLNN